MGYNALEERKQRILKKLEPLKANGTDLGGFVEAWSRDIQGSGLPAIHAEKGLAFLEKTPLKEIEAAYLEGQQIERVQQDINKNLQVDFDTFTEKNLIASRDELRFKLKVYGNIDFPDWLHRMEANGVCFRMFAVHAEEEGKYDIVFDAYDEFEEKYLASAATDNPDLHFPLDEYMTLSYEALKDRIQEGIRMVFEEHVKEKGSELSPWHVAMNTEQIKAFQDLRYSFDFERMPDRILLGSLTDAAQKFAMSMKEGRWDRPIDLRELTNPEKQDAVIQQIADFCINTGMNANQVDNLFSKMKMAVVTRAEQAERDGSVQADVASEDKGR